MGASLAFICTLLIAERVVVARTHSQRGQGWSAFVVAILILGVVGWRLASVAVKAARRGWRSNLGDGRH